jgi:hypothetical protein
MSAMRVIHRFILLLLLLFLLLLTQPLFAQTKVSALAIGDYYWVLQHHNESLENRNGFWLRRIFLTVDQTLGESITARFRLEANGPGDFTSSTTLEPYVKDAWLKWKRNEALSVIVGMAPNPVLQSGEDFWGYRPLEKSPLDLHRLSNPRDLGVGVTGRLSRFRYHLVVGNGANIGGETDAGKQVSMLVGVDQGPFLLELSGEHNDRDVEQRSTIQVQAGWHREGKRAGVLVAHQTRNDIDLDIASVFGVYPIRSNAVAVVRVDRMFHPNPEGAAIPFLPFDPQSASTLFIAGLDFKLHKQFGVIPNVEFITYDEEASADLLPRVTFYYSF